MPHSVPSRVHVIASTTRCKDLLEVVGDGREDDPLPESSYKRTPFHMQSPVAGPKTPMAGRDQVKGAGFRIQGAGFSVGSGFRNQGAGFRAQGAG